MTFVRLDLEVLNHNPRAQQYILGAVTTLCSILALASLYIWLSVNPARSLVAEVPGTDGSANAKGAESQTINLAGVFQTFDGQPSSLPGEWPAFRGPRRDNLVLDGPKLADSWGEDGPKVLWKVPVGDGYASPAVYQGRVYLMDYDVDTRSDAIRCLSLDDGKEIWRRSYGNNIKRNHGMSRTIPAVSGDSLVVMGPKCHVIGLDTLTGDFRWGIDLQKDYGTTEPLWYTGQCPLIDDGKVIVAVCGTDVLMMAVDCKTGEVVWKVPNPDGWNMSHSSVMLMTLLGKRMYVYSALGGTVAVSGDPETAGQLIFALPWDAKVVAPSPIQAGDDLIFVTTGYGRGSRLLKLRDDGGKIAVDVVYDKPPDQILACEQQTPIFRDGLIYGIMPKDAGALKQQLVCYKPDGTLVWSSGQDNRFGLGPFLIADNKFFILDDKGTLTMADATKQEFVRLGSAEVLTGHDAWGPMALAGTRLLVRELKTMACVELGASS